MAKYLTALIVIIVGVLMFWEKGCVEDKVNADWQGRMANAQHTIDSLYTARKPDTVRIYIPAKPLPPVIEHSVDSTLTTKLRQGVDSLQTWVHWLAQPVVAQPLTFSKTGDTVLVDYDPLTHQLSGVEHAAPQLTVIDTMRYPLPPIRIGKPWYNDPAWFIVGAAVGIIIKTILK